MEDKEIPTKKDLIKAYNILVKNIDEDANSENGDSNRAYGGIVRAGKGSLVESITKGLVRIAWENLGGDPKRLSMEKEPIIVPIKMEYVKKIKNPDVREYILANVDQYFYRFKTDVHVYIDDKLILGVECKAYTENAMLKRIMVDFTFLKQAYPRAHAVLLQLESQLGGDYSEISKDVAYGSFSTHAIMSYFDIDLNIITLLEGERKVDKPIHRKEFYKELKDASVEKAVKIFEGLLKNAESHR